MNQGDSVIGAELKKLYHPYITATFLDHSYKFFAPNPGPSHLVRYDLYFADGSSRVNRDDQILPDRVGHWPRLLYHRHFMLTEFMNWPVIWRIDDMVREAERRKEMQAAGPSGIGPAGLGGFGPAVPPGGPLARTPPLVLAPPPAIGEETRRIPVVDLLEKLAREAPPAGPVSGAPEGEMVGPGRGPDAGAAEKFPPVVAYWRAAAAYLARKHGAVRADLYYREHGLPSIEEFKRAKRLDPPESYVERLLVSYRTNSDAGATK
jgi:hypothetical protein